MKNVLAVIFGSMMILGVILITSSTIGSIGYALYLWSEQGMDVGVALWTTFKMWLTTFGSGIVMFITGIIGSK